MWNDLLDLGVSVPDKILRTVAVYVGLIVLLRLAGKRDLAQLNSFDLVVVLLLSNVVQNAVIGPDDSLLGGLLGAAVLVGVNAFNVHVVRPRRGVASLLEGTTTVLAYAGAWVPEALRKEGVRTSDLEGALRRQNAYKVEDVAALKLEPGGTIVVDLKPELENATKADVERLEAKLDRLLSA
jgi:uncharacterized membrane protein YcaP (DUF421 family)